jgi:putative ABC transport system permease protein
MFGNGNTQAILIIPWLPIAISIVVVFIMVLIVMRFAVRRIEERNIIETIRSESY